MRYINLFAGLGGIIDGLIKAGDEVAWALEPDKDAAAVLAANFPTVPVRSTDLKSLHPRDVPHVDAAFVGAPSCDSSLAARLTWPMLSVVSPRAVILDTETSSFAHESCIPWLESIEYVRHDGDDGFIVFLRKDVKIKTYALPFPDFDLDDRRLSDVLEAEPDESLRVEPERMARLEERNRRTKEKGFGFWSTVLSPEGRLPHLCQRFSKNPYDLLVDDGKGPRLLSPLECARIVGLRDSCVPDCSRTKSYKLITQTTHPECVRQLSEELKVWI